MSENAGAEGYLNSDANFEIKAAVLEIGEFTENHQQVCVKEEEKLGTGQEWQVECNLKFYCSALRK
jgi:hypothetical protein